MAGATWALAFLAGCVTSNGPAELLRIANNPPEIDRSTPEKTVQSHWAIRDWDMAYTTSEAAQFNCDAQQRAFYRNRARAGADLFGERISRFGFGLGVEDLCETDRDRPSTRQPVLSRDIVAVRMKSDAEAEVETVVKNVTPIPPELKLSAEETFEREYGRPMKYILKKEPGGWSIDWILYRQAPWVDERDDGTLEISEEYEFEDVIVVADEPDTFDFIWVGLEGEY